MLGQTTTQAYVADIATTGQDLTGKHRVSKNALENVVRDLALGEISKLVLLDGLDVLPPVGQDNGIPEQVDLHGAAGHVEQMIFGVVEKRVV